MGSYVIYRTLYSKKFEVVDISSNIVSVNQLKFTIQQEFQEVSDHRDMKLFDGFTGLELIDGRSEVKSGTLVMAGLFHATKLVPVVGIFSKKPGEQDIVLFQPKLPIRALDFARLIRGNAYNWRIHKFRNRFECRYNEFINHNELVEFKDTNPHSNLNTIKVDPLSPVQVGRSPYYKIIHQLGKGGFGDVYKAKALDPGVIPHEVALKFEIRSMNGPPFEWQVYDELSGSVPGVPTVYFKGRKGDHYIMVLDILDKSLDKLVLNHPDPRSRYGLISLIAVETIYILEQIHARGFVHCDIKPENIMIDKNRQISIIDFGLATKWCDTRGDFTSHTLRANISGVRGHTPAPTFTGGLLIRGGTI